MDSKMRSRRRRKYATTLTKAVAHNMVKSMFEAVDRAITRFFAEMLERAQPISATQGGVESLGPPRL
jgi:hypothetical protein